MSRLILFNKPYGVLCQFTDPDGRPTLADYIKIPDVYAAGRLDYDSEGLLLLTDNGRLQHQIAHPTSKQPKVYWAQVEGEVTTEALYMLRYGVDLKDGRTAPAQARVIPEPQIWARTPPIRERKSVPTTWIELTITEGRNRQVRRMTAAVGHPTLRLIRRSIGKWHLEDLQPGEQRALTLNTPPDRPQARPVPRGRKAASTRRGHPPKGRSRKR